MREILKMKGLLIVIILVSLMLPIAGCLTEDGSNSESDSESDSGSGEDANGEWTGKITFKFKNDCDSYIECDVAIYIGYEDAFSGSVTMLDEDTETLTGYVEEQHGEYTVGTSTYDIYGNHLDTDTLSTSSLKSQYNVKIRADGGVTLS